MSSKTTVLWLTAGSLLVAGCATSIGSRAQEAEQLKTQVASLEERLSGLNQRVEELSSRQGTLETQRISQQASSPEATSPSGRAPTRKAAISTREIQLALRETGFYHGTIDGKQGPQTREALKAFQRSQGLTPDGVAGPKTQTALAKFLEKPSSE